MSIDNCSEGQEGCRAVERIVSQPPATIDGAIQCDVPGSAGWCRGGGQLSLSATEPLAGYEILALEGSHNGTPFACDGVACTLPLVSGGNNLTFWAISSYGDTSEMGSAGVGVDPEDPSLSGSVSGVSGDAGWFVSEVTVEAGAGDVTSGVASLEVQIDGGGWANYAAPIVLGDGSHVVDLRAFDLAGNNAAQSLAIEVDTQAPVVSLTAALSFCPGCGDSLEISYGVDDGGSGVAGWSIVAEGEVVASGEAAAAETISWDGGGLRKGPHMLELEAHDAAGNSAGATFDFTVIRPTPKPKTGGGDADEGPVVVIGLASPTAAAATSTGTPPPTRTVTATRAAVRVPFEGIPAAPPGPASPQGPISDPGSPSPPVSTTSVPPAVYGGAEAAVVAAAVVVASEERRRRKQAEARKRAEMAAANRQAEAEDVRRRSVLGAIIAAAEAARRAARRDAQADARTVKVEERLEPKVPPPATLDLAKWKQADYAAGEAWEAGRKGREGAAAYAAYRAGEHVSVPFVASAPEKAWWQKAVDWVDQHQVAVSLAVGVVVGAAVIALTAGTATPLVVAGLAALAAGGSVAFGTAGLNRYYDRPWNDNLLRNAGVAAIGSTAIVGAHWLATGGLVSIAGTVGTTVGMFCGNNPAICSRIEPVMQAIDTGEQLALSAQLAFQTATHDPRAGETYLELQLEMMDGGVPGNTAARELGDETLQL
ncbi:MAG TPA: hypothetical protein VK449_01215, partial [Anaerolineales bacterium]|nr:hypothetical protein [Anaerolineales bacterium]